MPYDSLIDRSEASALVPEEVASEIIRQMPDSSAVLSLFRRRTLSTNQMRMPVLSALPLAYFVNGDTGLKDTTEAAWANKFLNVEELATIVPIPDAVIEDASYDLWAEIEPLLREAIGRALDDAVFFGTNKPASWPDDIVTSATAASNVYEMQATPAEGGVAEDINQTMALVEADGFDVNGFVTDRTFRSILRGARASDGQKLLDLSNNTVEGNPVQYAMRGQWPTGLSAARLFAGDFTQGIVGVRRDITLQRANQAVIQDGAGAIVYNLFQQDMTAVRVTFRCAFQVANPLTHEQATEANRYPFAVLTNASS